MLRELNIQNLAVIQATSIEFGPGLNVFTGQTGAGKSLILGAIQSLLGLKKSAAKMIRPGTEQARISGVFDILDADSAEQVGLTLDLDLLPGDELVLTRKIFATGVNAPRNLFRRGRCADNPLARMLQGFQINGNCIKCFKKIYTKPMVGLPI